MIHFKCVKEVEVLAQVKRAVQQANDHNNRNFLRQIETALPGELERQFKTATSPYLRSKALPSGPKGLSGFSFEGIAETEGLLNLKDELRRVLEALGNSGVQMHEMPLAIAFCMFMDALDVCEKKPPADTVVTPTKKKKVRRSIWTIQGGSTGLQQTRPKLKY